MKKRDKRGRVLNKGEQQRSDGRYMFRYVDASGSRRTVYSWRLVETDRTPEGKKDAAALRTMEKQISRDMDDLIDSEKAKKTTVDKAFERMMTTRIGLKSTTRLNYRLLYEKMVSPKIGHRKLLSVQNSDIKNLYITLVKDEGYSVSTVLSVHNLVFQTFEQAVFDRVVRYNPASKAFRAVKTVQAAEPKKRRALTSAEQEALVTYVRETPQLWRYRNLLTVLLGTGLRIGEALGLRWSDCNFEEDIINVNHQIRYKETEEERVHHYFITTPKTGAGYRLIPMLKDVKEALLNEKRKPRPSEWSKFEVDGYKDFVFLNMKGKPYSASSIYEAFGRIVRDYNDIESTAAAKDGREPVLLPKFGPHVLRHTFCTRLCENECNLKLIQDIMGHSDIKTTMNIYNEVTDAFRTGKFAQFDGKVPIS